MNKRSRKTVESCCKEIIYNVSKYLKINKEKYGLKYNIVESTAEVTGVSTTAVKKIIKEAKSLGKNPKFSTPENKRKLPRLKRIECNDFTEGAIRRKIYEYYVLKKECPTVKKMLADLRNDGVLNCSKEYLRKKIIDLGFRWSKYNSNRLILTEKPEIVGWRWKYLQAMKKYQEEKRNIVYLDEMQIHETHKVSSFWQSKDEISNTSAISEKGPCFIIVHAGGEVGFVPNPLIVFKLQSRVGDYHGNMNYNNFFQWMNTMFFPNIPENSVVVLDNCTQKEKRPNAATLKVDIINWLQNKGINIQPSMKKSELLELVKTMPEEETFVIDDLIKQKGHDVLHLPPYHPDLNPMKLVWGRIKGCKAMDCTSLSLEDKKCNLFKVVNEYTQLEWQKCCSDVKLVENKYREFDALMDEAVDEAITNLESSSSTEDKEGNTLLTDSESDGESG